MNLVAALCRRSNWKIDSLLIQTSHKNMYQKVEKLTFGSLMSIIIRVYQQTHMNNNISYKKMGILNQNNISNTNTGADPNEFRMKHVICSKFWNVVIDMHAHKILSASKNNFEPLWKAQSSNWLQLVMVVCTN